MIKEDMCTDVAKEQKKKERNGLKSRNEMTSERIKIMINRVRSIDELEPMKYD